MTGVLAALLGCIFIALLLGGLLLGGAAGRGDTGRRLAEQVDQYRPRHRPAEQAAEGAVSGAALGGVARLLRSRNSDERLAQRLDLAAISRTPAEWVLLACCATVVLAAVIAVATGNALIGIVIAGPVGWLAARLVLSVRIDRRRAAFSEQLPGMLQLAAGSLQSGFSLPQALDAIAREGMQPISGEFARALAETRIGVELPVALDRLASRMDSTDLRWTVMAISIQRDVGGNLAEVLANTVATMRERTQLRRHVRALSAEGRLSAYILIALPIVVGGWLFISSPVYMRPLFTTAAGVLMLVLAVVLMAAGALWMRQLIKVEV